MPSYADLLNMKETPQSQPLSSSNSTAKQVQNSAGGFVFSLSCWKRLERFLILGSDSNTYYASAHKLTKENAGCVNECWSEDHERTATTIAGISSEGRAAKNSPAIFAVALGTLATNVKARQAAYSIVGKVCRTSTHLFEFVATCKALGKGSGRGFKNAIANWYAAKTDEQLAYQLIKYRQREGYTHRDLFRISHPKAMSIARSAMFDWACGREGKAYPNLPNIIKAHIQAMATLENEHENGTRGLTRLIAFHNLPWEALPTWANTKPEIWKAQLDTMGLTALMRNLGNMTRIGVFDDEYTMQITARCLGNIEELRKARLHPFNILVALKTYASGKGFKGSNGWYSKKDLIQVLEAAFYKSFHTITPSNKRTLLALDVSGSMTSPMNNSPLTVREASSAMALVTLNSEEVAGVLGFTSLHGHNYGHPSAVSPLNIHRGMSIENVCNYTDNLPFSGTDCSLPMLYAIAHNLEVDNFVIYTDSETWAGNIHPVEALKRYRLHSGILDAKLTVVGMTSTGFSIADPNDANMLDIVGFDASAPSLIADFCRGTTLLA